MEIGAFVKIEIPDFHFAEGHDVLRFKEAVFRFVDTGIGGELNEKVHKESDRVFGVRLVVEGPAN